MLELILTGVALAGAGGGWAATAGTVLLAVHGVAMFAAGTGLVAVLGWLTVRRDEREAAEAVRADRLHDWAVRRLRLECRRLHRAVGSAPPEPRVCAATVAE